jgi:hypothetical protein
MMYQAAAVFEETLASLFQPDTLISDQYFENFRRSRLEPEKKLMLAVLEDGVRCFQENVMARSGRRKKLFDEAEEWILEENSDRLFSFESACEVLGFNPQYVRHGLLRWKEKKSPKHHSAEAA